MPTRNARNATAFTNAGLVKIRNAVHQRDQSPLDANCDCATCQNFSRGYLRHLFLSGEMLGPMLLSLHNITYYQRLMQELREAILAGRSAAFRLAHLAATGCAS